MLSFTDEMYSAILSTFIDFTVGVDAIVETRIFEESMNFSIP